MFLQAVKKKKTARDPLAGKGGKAVSRVEHRASRLRLIQSKALLPFSRSSECPRKRRMGDRR